MFGARAILFLLCVTESSASLSLIRKNPEPPLITPSPICASDCLAHIDSFFRYRWQSYVVNTTITAATLEHIIYPKYGNTTRTKLRAGDIPDGYEAPQRNKAGTVVTTITLSHGPNKTLETVLAYPTPFSDYPDSFWWSGTLSAPGSGACQTEATPITTLLPPRLETYNWSQRRRRDHVDPLLTPQKPVSRNDGSNYVLVADKVSPEVKLYKSYFGNDTALSQCRPHNLPKAAALAPSIPNGALYVTVTATRTETRCKPDLSCNVRAESTRTGSLVGPTPKSLLKPSSALSQAMMGPHDTPTDLSGAQMPEAAPRVHLEPQASSLIVPSSAGNRPQPAADNGYSLIVPPSEGDRPRPAAANDSPQQPSAQPMMMGKPQITPPPFPPLPPNRDSLPIGTLTIGGIELPVDLIPQDFAGSMGPHVEQTAAVVQIGTRTAEMGETITINNRLIAITEAPDGARLAIVAPLTGADITSTLLLSQGSPNQFAAPAAGGLVHQAPSAPTAPAIPVVAAVTSIPRQPVTVANLELTPNNDGGYSVGGLSLSRGGAVTVFGVDPRADFLPSPVLISLTTDMAGHEVFGVNGQSTTLSSPDFAATGHSSSMGSGGSKKGGAGRAVSGLDVRLSLLGCASFFVLGIISS